MKKIISLSVTALIVAALAISASAVGHTSADQVFGADGVTDLAAVGNNDVTGTSLGTITDDRITLWGWYADERKITEFGYRYGDKVTLGSTKYTGGGDDQIIAGQAAALGYTDGESVRFRISDIPVMKGTDVELYAVAKLENGDTVDIWRVTYTSENGADQPGTQGMDTTGGTTPQTPANPQTADGAVTVAAVIGCAALAGAYLSKKRK
ncbi:MAG: hypothetical protein J5879_08700 [Clostridia bacterium]|nr:hypothetical protein [Clostridia bacterium]